jgi:hypothetical protein
MDVSTNSELKRSLRKDFASFREWFRELPPDASINPDSSQTFSGVSRSRRFNAPKFLKLSDGTATLWTTSEFLEFNSHRLIVPAEGEDFAYHREPFGVHGQKIPSEVLDLIGIEAVAEEPRAVTDIARLAGEVSLISQLDWADLVIYSASLPIID